LQTAASSQWVLPEGTFVSMFWIVFSVEHLLAASGSADVMKFDDSQRFNTEQFGTEISKWAPPPVQKACSGEPPTWVVPSAIASALFVVAYRPGQVPAANATGGLSDHDYRADD
jgi:hypothetical protein